MTTQHIIVMGAGLMGLCTADALEERGAAVTVIDARSGPCEGTSFSNSGMIHPSQAKSWGPQTQKRRLKSDIEAELYAASVTVDLGERSKTILLAKMEQLGFPERASGCLQILPDLDTARAIQASQKAIGVRTEVIMDPIDSFGLPACRYPDDRSGDARLFGCALEKDLSKRGVEFVYDAKDVRLRRDETGFRLNAGGVIFSCDQLVITAGTGSPDLLSQLDVRMILTNISGAAVDFPLPNEQDDFPSCPVMDTQSRSALTIFSDRLRLSGGWGLTDPAELVARWIEIAPGLMSRLGKPLSTWTSKRPVSPVGRPYISPTSIPGLWVNTGHGHMGWTLCAGSGELLAEMMLEGREDKRFAFAG